MDDLTSIIALSRLPGINRQKKRQLLDIIKRPVTLFEGRNPLSDPDIEYQLRSFNGWRQIENELAILRKMGVTPVTIKDEGYPVLLKNTPDPPLVLYRKGPLDISSDTIAIVGSRRATFAGLNLAEKIAGTLSSLGITVVSGFARGIDTASHKGAIKEKGKTIAVLGCGMDICYPAENKRLFEDIGNSGVIVTEYGLGEKPLGFHFPERNRIIAGLSRGVLVVEATQRSGSLITARLAIEYGRDVMSVPGSIFSEEYKGANMLIKEGAKLIDGIEDIIANTFPGITLKKELPIDMDREAGYIYSLMGFDRIHVDEVIEKSGMETKRVMALLTRLEMEDLIRAFPGGFYIKK